MTSRWAAGLAVALVLSGDAAGAEKDTFVYVGTDAAEAAGGIHLFRLQPQGTEVSQNVTLVPLGLATEVPPGSFFEIDLRRRLLFAVSEGPPAGGRPLGAVRSFAIDATGRLTPLGQQPAEGRGPSHLSLDRSGRYLLVANAAGASIAVLPVGSDGRLGEATGVVRHRQGHARPSCVTLDPANRFALVCEAGLDTVAAYRFDAEKGTLASATPARTAMKVGTAPRRLVFGADGRFAYVAGESSSTITVFAYDEETGALGERQVVSTVPEYFDGENAAAELVLHPSGRYLYVSNRGHDSVVLFAVEPSLGTLTFVEEQGTGGRQPVHFGLEPSGKHLAIANHGSDTVLASRVDAGNGRLKPSGIFARVAAPACVRFLPPPEP